MSRIRVTIDKLVLNGFSPEQRKTLVAEFHGELERELSGLAAQAAWGPRTVPVLRLRQQATKPGVAGIGTTVARRIGGGVKR